MADSGSDKHVEKHVEAASSVEEEYLQAGLSPDDAYFLANFSHERRTKCIRKVCISLHLWLPVTLKLIYCQTKIDWRLCPALMILYLCAYIDRANIGEPYRANSYFTLQTSDKYHRKCQD
jgi:hypothetical protein